jgi:Uma2 family endonuclease
MADTIEQMDYRPVKLKHVDDLSDDVRYELIDNVIYLMSASPRHEAIVAELIRQFGNYLRGKPCRLFGSNLGYDWTARLTGTDLIRPNVKKQKILPDISVVCGEQKFGESDYSGVPSLIVEVLSPSTADRDFDIKKRIYEAIGVKEYWVVFNAGTVHTYVLENNAFTHKVYEAEESGILKVPVTVFPSLEIEFDQVVLDIN